MKCRSLRVTVFGLVMLLGVSVTLASAQTTLREWLAKNSLTIEQLLSAPFDYTTRAIKGEPVDAVLSEWQLDSVSPWAPCEPSNSQAATEFYARSIVLPALNGGAIGDLAKTEPISQPCTYVPPTPLVIAWPATADPQSAWRDVLPTTPSAGWRTCTGYPEPRFLVISQWHDSEEADFNHMRHIHDEVCIPRVVRTPTMLLEQRAVNFHWQGGTFDSFRKVVQRGWVGGEILPAPVKDSAPGLFNRRIPLGADGHQVDTYGPTLMDLSKILTPGWTKFELDTSSRRPDGMNAQTRFVPLYVFADPQNTGAEPLSIITRIGAEGWVSSNVSGNSQIGYLNLTAWGMQQFDTDERPAFFYVLPKGVPGATLHLKVMKNPDLHKHDVVQTDGSLGPDYGEVLFETTYVMPDNVKDRDAFKIPHPPMALGDKILIRVAVFEPTIGAGATLVGWAIGKGQ